MAFKNDKPSLKDEDLSIILMTIKLKNNFKPLFQPVFYNVELTTRDAKNQKIALVFESDTKSYYEEDDQSGYDGNSYMLRLPVKPGSYEITGFVASVFPKDLSAGYFFVPMTSKIEVTTPGIFYLGHVDAVLRERKGPEFRAAHAPTQGGYLKVIGANDGTFDIIISDQFKSDEQLFKLKFDALKNKSFQKTILEPFDRAEAQKRFEEQMVQKAPINPMGNPPALPGRQ